MYFPRSIFPGTTLASENTSKPLPRQAQKNLHLAWGCGKSQKAGKVPPGEFGINGFTEVSC